MRRFINVLLLGLFSWHVALADDMVTGDAALVNGETVSAEVVNTEALPTAAVAAQASAPVASESVQLASKTVLLTPTQEVLDNGADNCGDVTRAHPNHHKQTYSAQNLKAQIQAAAAFNQAELAKLSENDSGFYQNYRSNLHFLQTAQKLVDDEKTYVSTIGTCQEGTFQHVALTPEIMMWVEFLDNAPNLYLLRDVAKQP